MGTRPIRMPTGAPPWWCVLALAALLVAGCATPAVDAASTAAEETERAPFLWRIGADTPSYLFGSVHLGDPRVLDLDPAVLAALEASDAVYTELPFDPGTKMRMLQATMLPEGESLAEIIPDELYQRVDRLLGRRGISIRIFDRFEVWALAAQLPLLDQLDDLVGQEPLDQWLYSYGLRHGKEVGGLETVEEQAGAFDAIGREAQVKLLRLTVEELEHRRPGAALEELVQVYLAGDLDGLVQLLSSSIEPAAAVSGPFRRHLIIDRNERIAERIAGHLAGDPQRSHFFVTGALHLPGDRGLIELLRQQGLVVERVPAAGR
jgi:hypothetical protein